MMFTPLLKELLNELELARGKDCLLFVFLDGYGQFIEGRVEEAGFAVHRVTLQKEDDLHKIVEILLKWEKTEENTVYFVYGLMNQAPEILSYLNLHRDFLHDIKRPILILGSEYELRMIYTLAPDLWRFRSRTYDFSKKKEKEEIKPEYTLSSPTISFGVHEKTPLLSWGGEELRRRIELDEHLLELVTDKHRKSELYESLATLYFALENREKYDENIERFHELRRDDEKELSEVFRLLGDICVSKRNIKEAVGYYDKAVGLDSNDAETYVARGDAYSNLKDYERAIADYDKALEIDPGLAQAYNNRGLAYSDLKDYERAIADHDKALEIDPGLAQAYNNRGLAYSNLKDYDRAIADYDKAIEIDAGLTPVYNNRGLAYSELKDYDRAIADYDKVLELREIPLDRRARVSLFLGLALEKTGSLGEAAHAFKEAGILFFLLEESEDSESSFSQGFNLAEHTKHEDVFYCGLFLYILSKNAEIKSILQSMDPGSTDLKNLFDLAIKKVEGESINIPPPTKSTPPDIAFLLHLLTPS